MPLSLPSSPALNQTYTNGTKTWFWNGTTWKLFNTGGATISLQSATSTGISPPLYPFEGQLWLDTTDATLYIYYTNKWIEFVAAKGETGAAGYYGSRGTDANPLTVGTTADRPVSPVTGNMRVNTDTRYVEIYYSGAWYNISYIGYVTATGGIVTLDGNYKIHRFNAGGTFTVIDMPPGATIEYLVVGGGGGGGADMGGGGGAGGVIIYNNSFSPGAYQITVGQGGNGASSNVTLGTNGGSSSIANSLGTAIVTATGGGYGATIHDQSGYPAGNGGSGGGGSGGRESNGSYGGNPGQGIAGQGFAGKASGVTWYPGGGGGAGGFGLGGGSIRGSGGPGLPSGILGTLYYFGGGGGGAGHSSFGGDGGIGGGGGGATYDAGRTAVLPGGSALNAGYVGSIGTGGWGGAGGQYTGGGGGGGAHVGGGGIGTGGAGGSGIVVFRYRYQ